MKVICFDWGNTVMEELPSGVGPMAKWPTVEATPGVNELLAELNNEYICCLASNANESDRGMVESALARVGLNGAFERIYTSHDLHLQKPEPAYFQAIEQDLKVEAEDCLMVGNSFEIDANGAAAAGWNSILLMRELPTLSSHPLFGQLILNYADFSICLKRLSKMEIPTFSICQQIAIKTGVKPGLWRHTQKVALTGFVLACLLRYSGVEIDPIQVHRAGLLHDIDKPVLLPDPSRHGKLGAELIRNAGYPLLSRSIELHQVFCILEPGFSKESWETKILFLADKMVEKDKLVGAGVRMDHLIERHDDGNGRMRACRQPVLELESGLAQKMGMNPDRLLEYLHRKVDGVDLEVNRL